LTYAEKRAARLNCPTPEQTLLRRDLAAVVHDPSYSMPRRQTARRELDELRQEIDRKTARLDRELLMSGQSQTSFTSRAERILRKVREFERMDSRKFFERTITRYLTAKVQNATWAASLPLLECLSLEWLRDRRSLWKFLDAALARWKEFNDPKSVRHRSIVIHQLNGSKLFRHTCKERSTTPMRQALRLLGDSCAPRDEREKLYSALRTQKSRELSAAKRKRSAIRVTIR
jgi:hypothetical protein